MSVNITATTPNEIVLPRGVYEICDNDSQLLFRGTLTTQYTGGFKQMYGLPPMEAWEKLSEYALKDNVLHRVVTKKSFFTRKGCWDRHPMVLSSVSGLLFIYVKEKEGYVLSMTSVKNVKSNSTDESHVLLLKNEDSHYFKFEWEFGHLEVYLGKDLASKWRPALTNATLNKLPCFVKELQVEAVSEDKLSSKDQVVEVQSSEDKKTVSNGQSTEESVQPDAETKTGTEKVEYYTPASKKFIERLKLEAKKAQVQVARHEDENVETAAVLSVDASVQVTNAKDVAPVPVNDKVDVEVQTVGSEVDELEEHSVISGAAISLTCGEFMNLHCSTPDDRSQVDGTESDESFQNASMCSNKSKVESLVQYYEEQAVQRERKTRVVQNQPDVVKKLCASDQCGAHKIRRRNSH